MWNPFFKVFYILSSFYIILLMMKMYPRTREREKAWKLTIWSVGGSVVLAPIAVLITYKGRHWLREVSCLNPLHSNILMISIVFLGILHYTRIRLCTPAAPTLTPDDRADRNRLVLPTYIGLLPSLLYSELAGAGIRLGEALGSDCGHFRHSSDGVLY